ncbi:MAG: tetratricopeptide repeat protein, partial [Candidatus Zixiibacteriota bacterium]
VGQRLNVGHVLEGSVRKSGDRVRVTAQLIKVSDGFHLWSDKYDKRLDDIFTIQDEISRTIVETLKLKLTGKTDPVASVGAVPIEAYQLYSQGRYNLNLRTAAGFKSALGCFEQAIKNFPEYALAHTGLADTYFLLFAYDLMEPREAIARARHYVHQAIELNPRQSEAHNTLGGILAYYDWAWEEAEAAFKKSLEYGPGYATAHQWYGEIMAYQKRTDEAEGRLLRAHEMDPLSAIILTMLGCVYLIKNQPAEALKTFKQAYEIGTDNDATYAGYGFSLLSLGRTDESLEVFDEGCRRSKNGSYSITMRAHGHAMISKTEETKKAIEELEKRREREYVPEAYLATLYLDIGDEKKGISWLEKAIRRHNTELIFMAAMPYYANVRRIERAHTLLSVVGLPQ